MRAEADLASGWQAALELKFVRAHGASRLHVISQYGPLRVQRPFYPEGGEVCHVYLLHPPGGVVGGDSLDLDIRVDPGAVGLITTPGAAKFYRSAGQSAQQAQRLHVARDAVLEWLPQENIVFSGARARMQTRVDLEPGAGFIGWEITCLGRPASGERFDLGEARQCFELWHEDRPLCLERARYAGNGPVLDAPWGLQGRSVSATLLASSGDESLLGPLRAIQQSAADAVFAVTLLDEVTVCRYLGDHAMQARELFTQAWQVLRPAVTGREACIPRIWST